MIENTLLAWTERVDRMLPAVRVVAVTVAVILVGLADWATGPEISLTLLYSLVVVAAAWVLPLRQSLVVAVGAAALALAVRVGSDDHTATIVLVNACLRFGSFVLVATLTTALRRSFANLVDTARRDPMTGVLSRQGFLEELGRIRRRAQQSGAPLGVVYFDLDGLKVVNDQQGHAAGDALICTFVDRVGRHLRASDVFGRLGGDEFALVIERAEPDVIDAVVGRVLGDPGLPETSCGVAVFRGTYPTPTRMLAGADRRMYRDKQVRKGTARSERG